MSFKCLQLDCKRDAVDLLLKAAAYLEFCVRDVLVHIPPDIKYVNIFQSFGLLYAALTLNFIGVINELYAYTQEKVANRFAGWCTGGYFYSSTRPGIHHSRSSIFFVFWFLLLKLSRIMDIWDASLINFLESPLWCQPLCVIICIIAHQKQKPLDSRHWQTKSPT